MYAWYRQLHPSTGVENCLYCNFTSEVQKELVVSAGSQLTVYRLRRDLKVSGIHNLLHLASKIILSNGSNIFYPNYYSLATTCITNFIQ